MDEGIKDHRISWEYQLTVKLILEGISSVKKGFNELPLIRMKAMETLSPQECASFVSEKLDELSSWVDYTKDIYSQDINDSWGPYGVEGKKEDIEAACGRLVKAFRCLYDWEVSICTVIPDNTWKPAFNKLQLSSMNFIEDAESFFIELMEFLSNPNIKGKHTLTFNFEFPRTLIGVEKDIRRAQNASLPKSQWDDIWVGILKKLVGV
mgnify:FL=1